VIRLLLLPSLLLTAGRHKHWWPLLDGLITADLGQEVPFGEMKALKIFRFEQALPVRRVDRFQN